MKGLFFLLFYNPLHLAFPDGPTTIAFFRQRVMLKKGPLTGDRYVWEDRAI